MGMFGLEEDKKKGSGSLFQFDLEREMKEADKHQKLMKRIENRAQQVKNILSKGVEKELYNQLGVLLLGYASLLKVVGRIKKD